MYIKDDIAYADNQDSIIKVVSIRPEDDYKLWVKFSNGKEKIFDFSSLLSSPSFESLKDKSLFNSVYIDYGVPVWDNGNIDIAPERLYEGGIEYSAE